MEKFREVSVGGRFSPESDEPGCETIEQIARPEECEGHFENGPRILPAFRMLGQLTDRLASLGTTPKTVRMRINDILPEGVTYCASYNRTDEQAQQLILIRQKDIIITSNSAPLTFLHQSEIFAQRESFPSTDRVALDRRAIGAIIPQGDSLQLIDTILEHNPAQPDVLVEATHRVTPEDYEAAGISEYFYFDKSRLLEGFGQLAYIHFDQQLHPAVPTIPFFKDVTAHFNPAYQPHIGETIYYQLTHFETDFADRGDKGTGTISGRVMAANYRHLIANFTATVGTIKHAILAYSVKKITQQAAKAGAAEQTEINNAEQN